MSKQKPIKSRILILSIFILLLGYFFVPLLISQKVDQNYVQPVMITDGQILFAPMWNTNTYLVNCTGVVNHTWLSDYYPGAAVNWLGNGTILRTIMVGEGPSGAGGGIQKVAWNGTVLWDFRYNTNGNLSHHDITILPNGNVLLIAWETKTEAEAIEAGMNPGYVSDLGLLVSHIVEVQPTGSTSGDIVWEWHVWDHLIQDYDYSKANYGVVSDHPELANFNFLTTAERDWMHTNSIDYNKEFDQILISVHNFNEIWVIDHSTTTQEAAGHTGGNSGKGGDILYRWGNPRAYDRGITSDQKLFGQHDAQWIMSGLPGEGDILLFNNGLGRGYSSVDEIVPPVDENGEYYLAPDSAYGPEVQTWIYTASPPWIFYASLLSGVQRLASGNTLVCNGLTGNIFEVTPEGANVWQLNIGSQVFKVVYITSEQQPPEPNTPDLDCFGSLSWTDVKSGATVKGSFQVQNIGDADSLLNWTVNKSSINWGTWSFTPKSGEGLTPEDGNITVQVSVIVPNKKNSEFQGYLKIENQDNLTDFDLIPVNLKTPVNLPSIQTTIYQFILKFKNLLLEKIFNLK